TELVDEEGERLRRVGDEYGTVTRRPRRTGWFDAVASRFSCRFNGVTSAVITRLDILDAFPGIRLCTGYTSTGRAEPGFPANTRVLARCEPVYEDWPGWNTPTTDIRRFADLPANAQRYVRRLEELLATPVDAISVGPARDQVISVRPIF